MATDSLMRSVRPAEERVAELEARVRASSERANGSNEHIDALNELAWEIALHQTSRAETIAAEAAALAKTLGYRRGAALAKRTVGYCLSFRDPEASIPASLEAASELAELGELAAQATALNTVTTIYERIGNFDKALVLALECQRLNREAGDVRGEAWAHVEIGSIHLATGDLPLAKENFEKGRRLFESIAYRVGEMRACSLLGHARSRAGETEEALACFKKSLDDAQATGFTLGVVGALSAMGKLHRERGERQLARRYLMDALETGRDIVFKEANASVLLQLGKLDMEENELAKARSRLEQALQLVSEAPLLRIRAELCEALSELYEEQGELTLALRHYKEFYRLKNETFGEEGRTRLKNLQIQMGVERAEKEVEIHRLRYVELAAMQAQLVQSEKMALLGRLVAGLSHEINTPVGVINANCALSAKSLELIEDVLRGEDVDGGIEKDPRFQQAIEALSGASATTAKAGARIAELAKSLKNFARLDEAEVQRVDVNECLGEAIGLFRMHRSKTMNLETELGDVPLIAGRPGSLNQAFLTLLINASEAIERSGTIRVRSRAEAGRPVVEIQDTGRGIAPERLASLFEIEFTKKDAQVRLRMGLSNVKTTVESHGGSVAVESELGEGTTFTIRL